MLLLSSLLCVIADGVVVVGGGGVGVAKAVGVGAAEVGDTAAKPALCCMGEALVLVFHWLLLVFH